MKCPFCGNDEDKVIDSRPARDGKAIRRRRECTACSRRYTTYEAPETNSSLVEKSDGSREPFDRSKVLRGITIACNKRPVSADQIIQITSAIESAVQSEENREITTRQIGSWIMKELLAVDEVAYVRFASVFNRYESVDEFLSELQRIRKANSGIP
ncbi:transcriptional repressor NrdR [bacterium]|nr:MAG: transcriptional repressor NrdR [bacterium]